MFEFDNEIKSPTDDEIGNRTFSFHLAKGIADLKYEDMQKSFVIGICGKWGEGKTSIINMTLNYLEHLLIKKMSKNDIDKIDDDIKKEEKREKGKQKNFLDKIVDFLDKNIVFISVTSFLAYVGIIILIWLLLFLFFTNTADKFLTDYNILKKFFIWFCIITSIFFFIEKFTIPLWKFLSKKIEIKQPFIRIKNYFSQKEPLIIHFEPWNYNSSEEILKQFFKAVTNKLNSSNNECYLNVSKLITIYAKTLFNINLNFLENIFQNEEYSDIKDKIGTALKECGNKKIIIVIDDIDRLLPNEILTIFKMVKIIADFPNIVYLLSFDKEKVIEILNEEYNFDANDYIEKIIQVEKHIPLLEKETLRERFINKITNLDDINDPNFSQDMLYKLYNFALDEQYITNIRDLIKFANTFKFIHSSYKNENININDLIAITAVEVFEPQLYNFIRGNKFVLCSNSVGVYTSNDGTIYAKNNASISIKEFFDKIKIFKNKKIIQVLFPQIFILIKNRINNYRPANNLNEKISDDLKKIAESIDYDISSFKTEEHYRRIYDLSCFDNYFRINFDRNTLTYKNNKSLLDVLDNNKQFETELEHIYKENSNKVIDFINYWQSKYNKDRRNKINTINFIKNIISISSPDLINFLEKHYNNHAYLLGNIIKDFNEENQTSMISIKDIYDILKSQINNIENNCFILIYIICRLYKFPIVNPLENSLSEEDKNTLGQCIKLIRNNINLNSVCNKKNGCSCLDYLYNYLDSKDLVNRIINKLLKKGQEENLLKLLISAEEIKTHNVVGYGYINILFTQQLKDEKYLKKVKWILLKILNYSYFSSIKNNENYCVFDDTDGKFDNIAKISLKYLVTKIINCIGNEKIRNYNSNINDALDFLSKNYKDSSKQEILFFKSIAQKDDLIRFEKIIDSIQERIKDNKELFYKYDRLLNKLKFTND